MRRLAARISGAPRASSAGAPVLHARPRDVAARFEGNVPRAAIAPESPAAAPPSPAPPATGGGDWSPSATDARALADAKEQLLRVALDPTKGPLPSDAGAQLVAVARTLRAVYDSFESAAAAPAHAGRERRLPQALYWHIGYLCNKLFFYLDALAAQSLPQQPRVAPLSPAQARELFWHLHTLAGRPRVERVSGVGDGASASSWRLMRPDGTALHDGSGGGGVAGAVCAPAAGGGGACSYSSYADGRAHHQHRRRACRRQEAGAASRCDDDTVCYYG